MVMETKDWVLVSVAVLTLLVGPGWVKVWLEKRSKMREMTSEVLDDFLVPLQSILTQSKLVHEELTHDQQFKSLEYSPDYLQQHFSALPNSDPRKLTWKTKIDRVMEDNRRAVHLIQTHSNWIHDEDLRKSCKEFVKHANEWDAVWQAVFADHPVPVSLRNARGALAGEFPEKLDQLLEREIETRRKEVGL